MTLEQTILTWRSNPVKFVRDVFGATPEKWQDEALTALEREDRVSIRSGHGTGKSTLMAWAVLWFMSTRIPCKVPVTAPTAHQLFDVLWAELGKWMMKMPPQLKAQFELKHERLELLGAAQSSFAVARTSRPGQPEALQGFHSQNLMFLIDEASGVDDKVFEVAEGALSTEGAKVLMCANPTRSTGYFYDSHHKMRHRWHSMRVSCEDSSQVARSYLDDMATKYGIDSNVYRVRVLGEFPNEDDNAVIPLALCEAALHRDVEPLPRIMPVWGLDVARFGNCKTALVKRWGNQQVSSKTWAKRDTMEVAGLIMYEYEETASDLRPAQINVDSIGIGAGVVDRLRELGLPVVGVNVGETPSGKDRFVNLRAELWWRAREWLEARDSKLTDEELIAQLTMVTYTITSSGKIAIESKDKMLERGVESPDIADAFVLTFAGADRRKEHDRYERHTPRSASAWAA